MSIGIIQAQDAVILSPNHVEKGKIKDISGAVSQALFIGIHATYTIVFLEESKGNG